MSSGLMRCPSASYPDLPVWKELSSLEPFPEEQADKPGWKITGGGLVDVGSGETITINPNLQDGGERKARNERPDREE